MTASSELNRLLSLVVFNPRLNAVEGLDPFRFLLEKDDDGSVLRFLDRAMRTLEGERQSGLAYVVAEHYRKKGDLANLRTLFGIDDAQIKRSVLNALWGEPGSDPQMGAGIVELAIQAATHASPDVRTEACSVVQNQCAWGVDVTAAIAPLRALLDDESSLVRRQAAYAVGNLAKRKYDMSQLLAKLCRNAGDESIYVREASAWALWQLSRHKHDITSAVPELAQLLTDPAEWNQPRKNAAGALLHHAKKSSANTIQVRRSIEDVRLDANLKDVKGFLEQLAGVKSAERRQRSKPHHK